MGRPTGDGEPAAGVRRMPSAIGGTRVGGGPEPGPGALTVGVALPAAAG
jgi:hypothetical protein